MGWHNTAAELKMLTAADTMFTAVIVAPLPSGNGEAPAPIATEA